MATSAVVEIALGLVFVFLLLSLIATGVREWIAGILATRAKFLTKGITTMLGELANDVLDHGLVQSMRSEANWFQRILKVGKEEGDKVVRDPSYLASDTFSAALLDVIMKKAPGTKPDPGKGAPDGSADELARRLRAGIKELSGLPGVGPQVQTSIQTLWEQAGADLDKFRKNVEHWFDNQMDRVSGWYRRRSHIVLLAIGIAVAGGLNVDTITIARSLAIDAHLRQTIAAEATANAGANGSSGSPAGDETTGSVAGTGPTCDGGTLNGCIKELRSLSLPIGWHSWSVYLDATAPPEGRSKGQQALEILLKIIGILVTALAVSLGAPFWFGLLNRLTGIRASGNPPPRSNS